MQEWQWRDRWDASEDRPDLRVNGLGEVRVEQEGENVVVKVELVNRAHGNRWTSFSFDYVKGESILTLTSNEQVAFSAKLDREIARVLGGLEKLWACKPQMLATYPAGTTMPMGTPTYVPYRQPSVKGKMVRSGVAAFVTEEQIDHRGANPQLRYELYVLQYGDEETRSIKEDHSYEKTEGSALIAIVDLKQDGVVINTRHGKEVIAF